MTANFTNADGCHYSVVFNPTETVGNLSAPCDTTNAYATSFAIGASPLSEYSYQSSYVQWGGMWQWQSLDWALRAGYQFQHLNRDHVDDLIASRGGVSYRDNHIVVADVVRKISKQTALFVRGQAMSHQFVGEIPFIYNGATASKFDRRYGLVTFGVNMVF